MKMVDKLLSKEAIGLMTILLSGVYAGIKFVKSKVGNNWQIIQEHDIFAKFEEWGTEQLFPKDIQDEDKRIVVEQFLHINFLTWRKELQSLINAKGICNKCSEKCELNNLKEFTCFIKKVIEEKNKMYIAAGVPQLYLDRFEELFNKDNTSNMLVAIDDILRSKTSTSKQLYKIFTAFKQSMRTKRAIAISLANSMNGELSKAIKEMNKK